MIHTISWMKNSQTWTEHIKKAILEGRTFYKDFWAAIWGQTANFRNEMTVLHTMSPSTGSFQHFRAQKIQYVSEVTANFRHFEQNPISLPHTPCQPIQINRYIILHSQTGQKVQLNQKTFLENTHNKSGFCSSWILTRPLNQPSTTLRFQLRVLP